MFKRIAHRIRAGGFAAVCLAGIMTGCANTPATPTAVTGAEISGRVMGGEQPITGATIQIYAVGTSGYASASTPLLTRTVITDSNGSFNLTGLYTCPSAATEVYLTAQGGNPGLAAGTNNTAIAEIAALGPCGNLGPSTFIAMNEVTTVAAVWALSPFMSSITNVGTSSTNYSGIRAAFNTTANLASTAGGTTPGTTLPSIGKVPSTEINTLADILSACINSNGSTAPGTSCGTLMTAATPTGGSAPTDTVLAALEIAKHPGHNVAAVYAVLTATPAFTPILTSAPNDWTISVNYSSTAFNAPTDLAVDSLGDLWLLTTSGNSSVSELSQSSGIVATYSQTGLAYGHMAIDGYNDLWLTDNIYSNVVVLNSTGSRLYLNPLTGGGMNGPGPIAFDSSGNVWVVNNNTTLSKLNGSGVALSPSTGYAAGGLSGPVAIALDGSGNAFIANSGNNTVTRLSSTGTAYASTPFSGGGMNGPFAIALDSATNVWVLNRTGSSLSKMSATGALASGSPFAGGGLNLPVSMAVDGLGNVWVVNSGANTLSAFSTAGVALSGAPGYGSSVLQNPYGVAIDGEGSVWVMNLGSASTSTYTITQMVGVAAPVVTPMATAVANGQIGMRP